MIYKEILSFSFYRSFFLTQIIFWGKTIFTKMFQFFQVVLFSISYDLKQYEPEI